MTDEQFGIAGSNIQRLRFTVDFHGDGETEITENGIENFLGNFEVIHR